MFIAEHQVHELTMLILNKSQFTWENNMTKLTKEIAEKYCKVHAEVTEELKNIKDVNFAE